MHLRSLLVEEDGQDLVEYALLLAFIALAAVSVLSSMGGSLTSFFGTANNALQGANNSVTSPS